MFWWDPNHASSLVAAIFKKLWMKSFHLPSFSPMIHGSFTKFYTRQREKVKLLLQSHNALQLFTLVTLVTLYFFYYPVIHSFHLYTYFIIFVALAVCCLSTKRFGLETFSYVNVTFSFNQHQQQQNKSFLISPVNLFGM